MSLKSNGWKQEEKENPTIKKENDLLLLHIWKEKKKERITLILFK